MTRRTTACVTCGHDAKDHGWRHVEKFDGEPHCRVPHGGEQCGCRKYESAKATRAVDAAIARAKGAM